MKAWCLFEQSGTFKNEFIKLDVEAYDCDIKNDFGQTDFQIDLFAEIKQKFERGGGTIFDKINSEDIVLAFFPCIRFEDQIAMGFRGDLFQQKKWSDKEKIAYAMKLETERSEMYQLFAKLTIIAIENNLQLILENPYSTQHYLTQYFPIKAKIIDKNRQENGDYYVKPTQYWFINCEPKKQMLFESIEFVEQHKITVAKGIKGQNITVSRSMIHPQYANRFIRQEIL